MGLNGKRPEEVLFSMNWQLRTRTHPRRLAIEPSRLDLRVHRESTRALSDGSLLEHRHHLMKHGYNFGLTAFLAIKSSNYCRRRCERADLQSHLGCRQSVQYTFETGKWGPYLPSIANSTNFSIGSFHLLSQIASFPQFLDGREFLSAQVHID
jgi:hypothetical protein